MKKTLFLLALVAGIVMAEEETEEVADEGRALLDPFKLIKTAALASVLGPLGVLVEIGLQVVVLIALILFISTLKSYTGGIGDIFGKDEDYSTGYYPAPAYDVGATGGSSSYGSYKRSVDSPSVMDLPMVQRLTARVHEAIDNFNF